MGPGIGILDFIFARGWGIRPSKKLPGHINNLLYLGGFFVHPLVSFPRFGRPVCCSGGIEIFQFNAAFNMGRGGLLRGLVAWGPFATGGSGLAMESGSVSDLRDVGWGDVKCKGGSAEQWCRAYPISPGKGALGPSAIRSVSGAPWRAQNLSTNLRGANLPTAHR